MKTVNPRLIAARIIDDVTSGHSLAEILPTQLDTIKDPRDRAFVQALCYGVCRYYTQLDIVLCHFLQKPMQEKDSDVNALLLVGLYQILIMKTPPHAAVSETVNAVEALDKPWARGFINAILRECLRQEKEIPAIIASEEEAKYAHPEWMISEIREAWPQHWEAILEANNQHPPFSLRVNQQLDNVDNYLKQLQEKELTAQRFTYAPHGIVLDKPCSVDELPGFAAGHITVQDGAAQIASTLLQLQPNLRILDACAAPGGKLTHILELEPTSTVIAVESDKSRMTLIQDNLRRLNQTAKCICADAADVKTWWDNEPFDRILLDAPCSASGVIRRHPDIKLLRAPSDISALQEEQYHLLINLWKTLAAGGLLVYVTCSIFPDENVAIIKTFLEDHKDASEDVITADWGLPLDFGRQILPGMDNMDGFYFACIRKKN
jgi:16S rRNA (cytosine967-C5)-methyltransferase